MVFRSKFKRIKFRRKLTVEQRLSLLSDLEDLLAPKIIAHKYGVSLTMVRNYKKRYFVSKLVRKPVQWPNATPVLPYLFKK